MTDYDKLNMEIYDMIWKKYGNKYSVSLTGTIDPEYYEIQKANGRDSGLEISIRVRDEEEIC